jgi:hypothetical protein
MREATYNVVAFLIVVVLIVMIYVTLDLIFNNKSTIHEYIGMADRVSVFDQSSS